MLCQARKETKSQIKQSPTELSQGKQAAKQKKQSRPNRAEWSQGNQQSEGVESEIKIKSKSNEQIYLAIAASNTPPPARASPAAALQPAVYNEEISWHSSIIVPARRTGKRVGRPGNEKNDGWGAASARMKWG